MLISVLTYTVMQSLARYLGPAASSWTKTFYRCLFSVAFILAWMAISRERIRFRNTRLLLLRGITGAVAITFYFWTIDLIDLLHGTLYIYVHPVFAILFAVLLYRERFHWWMIPPLAGALAGLYLIVNPTGEGVGAADLVGIISAVSAGVARATVRELRKSDSPANVVLVFMLVSLAFAAVGVALIPGQRWGVQPTGQLSAGGGWLVLLGIGLFSTVSNILMTAAFRRLTTAVGSILALLIVPLTAAVAVLYFHEPLTAQKVAGGVLILASAAFISAMSAQAGPVSTEPAL